MASLRNTLLRLGEPELENMVGGDVVRMLNALGNSRLSAGALADLLQERGPELVFRDPDARRKLVESLPTQAARRLASELGADAEEDSWTYLSKHSFRRGSNAFHRLAELFDLQLERLRTDSERPPTSKNIKPHYGLYDFQKETLDYLRETYLKSEGRCVLHMPTGSGKTRTTMHLLSHLMRIADDRSVILWLAHSEELCDQAANEFEEAWQYLGDRSVSVARLYGGYEADVVNVSDTFLVASIQKLHRRSYSQQGDILKLKNALNLVVMDEAHHAIAPTYQHILELLSPQSRRTGIIGLTATPGRSRERGEEDRKLREFFFGNKVSIQTNTNQSPIEYLQSEGYLARPNFEYMEFEPDGITGSEIKELESSFDITKAVLKNLAFDEGRNLLVLERAIAEAKQGRKCLIFGCSVAHAQFIADVLRLEGIEAASITSDTPDEVRRRSIQGFKKQGDDGLQVLTNYGVLTTGFDAPDVEVGIIARPTLSVVLYSQMVGRVLRGPATGGSEEAKVITVVDDIAGFRDVYDAFSHWDELWAENKD